MENKDKIKKEALKLFKKITYSKTSVSDIAKAAGMGKGTIYLYYNSKEEIMHAIIGDRLEEFQKKKHDFYYNPDINIEKKINQLLMDEIDDFVYLKDLLVGTYEHLTGKLLKDIFVQYNDSFVEFVSDFLMIHKDLSHINKFDLKKFLKEGLKLNMGRIILFFLENDWNDKEALIKIIKEDINFMIKVFLFYLEKNK